MLRKFTKSFNLCSHIVSQKRFSAKTFNPRFDCLNYPCVTKHECKKFGCCKHPQESNTSSADQCSTHNNPNTNININLIDNVDINLNIISRQKSKITELPDESDIVDTSVETVSDVVSSTIDIVSDVASSTIDVVSDVVESISDST